MHHYGFTTAVIYWWLRTLYGRDWWFKGWHECSMRVTQNIVFLFYLILYWYELYIITVTSSWARWRLKSPALRLFTQPFIQTQITENIKTPRHWHLCGEFTGDRWIPRTNGQQRGKCFHLMTSSCENMSFSSSERVYPCWVNVNHREYLVGWGSCWIVKWCLDPPWNENRFKYLTVMLGQFINISYAMAHVGTRLMISTGRAFFTFIWLR